MKQGKVVLPVSVNLSRATLHHDGIVERYAQIVYDNENPFESVPIELDGNSSIVQYTDSGPDREDGECGIYASHG